MASNATAVFNPAVTPPPPDFPICLSTEVAVGPGGGVSLPDASQLTNDYDVPIEITEIRFLLSTFSLLNVNNVPQFSLASLIRASVSLGRLALTRDFIPLWLLGPRIQQAIETAYGFGGTWFGLAQSAQTVWDYVRWLFPHPLVVPVSASLLPKFQQVMPDGGLQPTRNVSPITVRMALIGRCLGKQAPRPPVYRVPYVAAFIPAPGVSASNNTQLVNPFEGAFYVQRFIGRVAASMDVMANEYWTDAEALPQQVINETASALSLSIQDNNDYDVVRGMVPWDVVFDPARKALNADRSLAPRDWYRVNVSRNAIKNGDGGLAGLVPMISMVGWREEEPVL